MEFLSTEMGKSIERKHVFSEFNFGPFKFMVSVKYASGLWILGEEFRIEI